MQFRVVFPSWTVAFPGPEYWAATAIHEINHSTGHPTRMNRGFFGRFGSESYACEVARVEMAAAFVCNALNLPTGYANHAAYIATWLKELKTDKYEIFRCAADAQPIADWTLGYHPEYAAGSQPQRPQPQPQHEFPPASRWSSRDRPLGIAEIEAAFQV